MRASLKRFTGKGFSKTDAAQNITIVILEHNSHACRYRDCSRVLALPMIFRCESFENDYLSSRSDTLHNYKTAVPKPNS